MIKELIPIVYWLLAIIIFAFAVIVLIQVARMDLKSLIQEPDGKKASLSRFQFLIFTFVIAGLYLTLCLESGTFLDIPNGVLGILGISGGGYVISKGIQK